MASGLATSTQRQLRSPVHAQVSRIAALPLRTNRISQSKTVSARKARRSVTTQAADDKSPLVRENEPGDYWKAANEKEGVNPIKDPLAILGIIGILLPFIIVGALVAFGVIDPSPRGPVPPVPKG